MPDIDKSWCTLRHLYNLEDLLVILRTTRNNIPKFFLIYTHCIYVFCVDLRADSIDHELTFITELNLLYVLYN